jgi:hypothetical protein
MAAGQPGEVGGPPLFHHADKAFRESIRQGGLQVSRDQTEWEGEPQKVYLTDNPVAATRGLTRNNPGVSEAVR